LAADHGFKSLPSDLLAGCAKPSRSNGWLLDRALSCIQPKPYLLLAWPMLILSFQFELQVKMVYHRIVQIEILQQSILCLIITPSPQSALEILLASDLFELQGFEIFLEEKVILRFVSNIHPSLDFD
jgi:hypothetical protein